MMSMRIPAVAAGIAIMGALALAGTGPAAAAATSRRSASGVSQQVLAEAAKHTMLSEINYDRELCGDDRSVETWLKDVVGDTAADIRWRGGACELTTDLNPLDAGSAWCGGATIVPKGHPNEPAEIEVYFEKPVNGKPGKAYAFRAVNYDIDGLDYKRFFPDFEYGYRQRYQRGFKPPETQDCD
jgi:hypothetical protein